MFLRLQFIDDKNGNCNLKTFKSRRKEKLCNLGMVWWLEGKKLFISESQQRRLTILLQFLRSLQFVGKENENFDLKRFNSRRKMKPRNLDMWCSNYKLIR